MSPDCILRFACYPCLRDETVSPGLPTRARLLIGSHSSREECLLYLSAVDFPRRVYRFPSAGFHLAVLRTHLGPGANLRCSARTVLRLHRSLLLRCNRTSRGAYHPTRDSQHSQPSRVVWTEVHSLWAPIKFVVANLPDVHCALAGTRAVSSRDSDFRS
jgi:hypothetical protein